MQNLQKQKKSRTGLAKNFFNVIKKYAVFKGRASRYEFWGFMFVYFVVGALMLLLQEYLSIPFLGLYLFVFLLPMWAVHVRRFHDINKSGWWMMIPLGIVLCMLAVIVSILLMHQEVLISGIILFFFLIAHPIIQITYTICTILQLIIQIIFLYWLCKKGDEGDNKYGAAPQ